MKPNRGDEALSGAYGETFQAPDYFRESTARMRARAAGNPETLARLDALEEDERKRRDEWRAEIADILKARKAWRDKCDRQDRRALIVFSVFLGVGLLGPVLAGVAALFR